jgi:hypothetical protein
LRPRMMTFACPEDGPWSGERATTSGGAEAEAPRDPAAPPELMPPGGVELAAGGEGEELLPVPEAPEGAGDPGLGVGYVPLGGAAGDWIVTVIVAWAVAAGLALSFAPTTSVYVPACVGTPVTAPVAGFRLSPGGSAPEITDHV